MESKFFFESDSQKVMAYHSEDMPMSRVSLRTGVPTIRCVHRRNMKVHASWTFIYRGIFQEKGRKFDEIML